MFDIAESRSAHVAADLVKSITDAVTGSLQKTFG